MKICFKISFFIINFISYNKSFADDDLLIRDLCKKIEAKVKKLKMPPIDCNKKNWKFERKSERDNPLLYGVFKHNETDDIFNTEKQVTLILAGVHGDEVPPIYSAFKFSEYLSSIELKKNQMVIIAPLVNPDGFFNGTRNNANKVDLNRNLPTNDWNKKALKMWRERRKSNPIHFPGVKANTEEGTKFQIDLIDKFNPDKILSMHSPLNFIDYDGPGDAKKDIFLSPFEKKAKELAVFIGETAGNMTITDYPFFPGSLGNYAGNEKNIPTITIEFASSNARKASKYYPVFEKALKSAIDYEVKNIQISIKENDKQ